MPRAPAPTRADFASFLPMQTRWDDNDEYGHMNNATYLALFDTAVTYWQLYNGIAVRGPDSWRFVVAESGCTYFRELGFPDPLEAGLRIPRLGGTSYRIEVALFRHGEDTAACLGHFVQVLLGTDGRPAQIPDDLRARLSLIAI